jgi:hypothetical protein
MHTHLRHYLYYRSLRQRNVCCRDITNTKDAGARTAPQCTMAASTPCTDKISQYLLGLKFNYDPLSNDAEIEGHRRPS